MLPFTERDITALKTELGIISEEIYLLTFDAVQYINCKVMTAAQWGAIYTEVRRNYPISMEPLPKLLQPLIEVAKLRVMNKRTSLPRRKDGPISSYNWDYEWEDYDRSRDYYDDY